MYGSKLSKRDTLMIGALLASLLLVAEPAAAQQDIASAPDATGAGAETIDAGADLDITLQVVDDAASAEDFLNTIELPEEVREIAEQRLAAALAAIKAAREMQSGKAGSDSAEHQALLADMAERRAELVAGAQASALAANEQAQQAVESAREAVEEALKNGLTSAEMQGMIEQMIQDIFGALPEEARGDMGDMNDVNGLLESLRGDSTAGADAGSGG
ncbi:hypothetical protein GNX18_12130 [Microbulbifer sp. SH-1]|uniref:hypothetical protein n=1 Tax=Microbulbifer sp. SH-1 TaxID=2681547 RepID=UPI00140B847E|nr:hypothetical protein [Microbulbifer sp. SH-1]QIL90419.1 hypothetical protein GNX18_12130 [Microbulbifer sp. SH-1]